VPRKIAVASIAASLATLATGGVVLTGSAAVGAKQSHSQLRHYDAKTVSIVHLDRHDIVSSVNLTSRHIATSGKPRGAGVFTCHAGASSSYEPCKAAIALKNGILFGTARVLFPSFKLTGHITGGSGVFKGATGTFSAVGNHGRKSILTVRYKT
jgi:hypothetical protein